MEISENSMNPTLKVYSDLATLHKENMSKALIPLSAVINLCETLKTDGINYCHWKSNAAIDRSASGDNDLDLLVSRADAQQSSTARRRLRRVRPGAPPEEGDRAHAGAAPAGALRADGAPEAPERRSPPGRPGN